MHSEKIREHRVPDVYELTRDGQHVLTGSMQEAYAYIHRVHSFSFDHACKYEGYKLTLIERKP